MIRTIWFFIKLAVLILLAFWLADRPGTVSITWQGYVLETEFWVLAAALLLIIAIGGAAYHLWRVVLSAPGGWRGYFIARRREKGYRALTQGLVAVAAGDDKEAIKLSKRADVLLNEPPLTLLLSAQAAQLGGDDQAASRYFESMLDEPDMRFLGLRGLLMQKLKSDETDEALLLARAGFKERPDALWLGDTLLELEAKSENWPQMLKLLKQGGWSKDKAARIETCIRVELSRRAESRDHLDGALKEAKKAHHLTPDFIPAIDQYARLLAENGQQKKAARLIHKIWKQDPHPYLSDIYRFCGPKDESLLDAVKRFEKLHKLNPDHYLSHTALAHTALDAGLVGKARDHAMKAFAIHPGKSLCRLMAKIEECDGKDKSAQNWLTKTIEAPEDDCWVCNTCYTPASAWNAVCGACGHFMSFAWQEPRAVGHNVWLEGQMSPTQALKEITKPPSAVS